MKKISLIILSIFTYVGLWAQASIVNTGVDMKHAIIEEFSGVNCSNCPAGHAAVRGIMSNNPGKVHVVMYSPSNSNYTNPGSSATDFRRSFADAFYTPAYCSPSSGSRFMPSAFINRQLGNNNDLLQSRTAWTGMASNVLAETAPLNVAVQSNYNASTQMLDVVVEVYYVSDVTSPNSLYVLLTEDSLTSNYQAGSSASSSNPYVYEHHFRENISQGQWGDDITGATTAGTTYRTTYSFDLNTAIDPINIDNAHVVAFVCNKSNNYEIYSGISAAAKNGIASSGSGNPAAVNGIELSSKVQVYPVPAQDEFYVQVDAELNSTTMQMLDPIGRVVYAQELQSGDNVIQIPSHLTSGNYLLQIQSEEGKTVKQIQLQ